ncbi:MAG: DUF4349 domain-containing protein [Anaerolineae bacterium]|nr:DUF4349 domain-containing protein [Anaerolineae bacterium]
MKRIILILTLLVLFGAGVITAVPARAQNDSPHRLVIKNGDLQVLVTDTDTAVQTALNLVTGFNGYVLGQRVWEGDGRYRYATLTVGVPAATFEAVLHAFKTLGTVKDEQVTGEDVTDTAVDLTSRLDNLHSNQERVRTFLDQTLYMTETLDVHDQLTVVENEIGDLQGQQNYLTDRAGVATISLNIVPFIPTPTPQPTASPTPLPTPVAWNPGDTAQLATVHLTETSQSAADFALYRLITWTPWLLFLMLIAIPVRRLYRRYGRVASAKGSLPALWQDFGPSDDREQET